ncbi:MAG TPA: hypothetical protein VEK09_05035, partial [Jatrophihabitantaceae bacterium]|nr:hypothetical protein [Jatrophihabitantaceae bacterium]
MTWLELGPDHPFGLGNLPYGSFADSAGRRHAAVRIGDHALSLTQATEALATEYAAVFADGSLDRFLAAGRPAWTAVRSLATSWLSDEARRPAVEALLMPLSGLELRLPFAVGDY